MSIAAQGTNVHQRAGVASLIGPRQTNQDSYLLRNGAPDGRKALAVIAVADGMGGHQDGEVASRLAVETAGDVLQAENLDPQAVRNAFDAADRRIRSYSREAPEVRVVGTTLTLAVVGRAEAVVGHVGDSRAYLFHGDTLQQVTTDHSRVGRLLRDGVISEEESIGHPEANVLDQALGASDRISVDVYRVGIGPGDVLLLSTDGLHGSVSREEIEAVLKAGGSMQEACQVLAELAQEKGSSDNVTVLAWQYPQRLARTGTIPGLRAAMPPPRKARATPAVPPADWRDLRYKLLVGAFVVGILFGIILRLASASW